MSDPSQATSFEWDDDEHETGNTAHLSRCRPGQARIEWWEAEEVFNSGGVISRNKNAATGDWRLVGRTAAGRALTLILHYDDETRTIRVITGWESTGAERRKYLD